jgi:hypothetical protein
VQLGGDAFADDDAAEVARILCEIVELLELAHREGTVSDFNGNACARFSFDD